MSIEYTLKNTATKSTAAAALDTPQPSALNPHGSYCLTGVFQQKSREECTRLVCERGGVLHDKPRQDTDYLVVGNMPSSDYKFGHVGTKTVAAMKLRAAGHAIKIISETTFLTAAAAPPTLNRVHVRALTRALARLSPAAVEFIFNTLDEQHHGWPQSPDRAQLFLATVSALAAPDRPPAS